MKSCFKCGAEKPLSEFYKHKRMLDGHLNKCKECTKRDVKAHRKNPKYREKVLAYDRARGNRQDKAYFDEYKKRFPKKCKAKNMVGNAIRDGRMRKETKCSECASEYRVEAHHDDYDFPLSVRWLCASCHKQWHGEHGPGKNGT